MALPRITRREICRTAGAVLAAYALPSAAAAEFGRGMTHIVLLGDSVFDNPAYVPPRQEVLEQLKRQLPEGWRASLAAVDGAVTGDVERQLARIPADATHLVVSAGGNDALRHASVINERASSVAGVLDRLGEIREAFWIGYRTMLDRVLARGLPTAVCTIYEARYADPDDRRLAATALTVLNDAITREAVSRGVPVIDLRVLFQRDEDYANAIEPSGPGGEKLAGAIVELVSEHDFSHRRSAFFVR